MDLISRQAAIDAVKENTFRLTFAEEQNYEGHVAWSAYAVYSDVIEGVLLELPSAQPERPKGEWIEKSTNGKIVSICPTCGYIEWDTPRNFCPACGMDMRGEK